MTINFTQKQMIDALSSDYDIHEVGCISDYGSYEIKGYIAIHEAQRNEIEVTEYGKLVTSPFYELYKIESVFEREFKVRLMRLFK